MSQPRKIYDWPLINCYFCLSWLKGLVHLYRALNIQSFVAVDALAAKRTPLRWLVVPTHAPNCTVERRNQRTTQGDTVSELFIWRISLYSRAERKVQFRPKNEHRLLYVGGDGIKAHGSSHLRESTREHLNSNQPASSDCEEHCEQRLKCIACTYNQYEWQG